MEKENDLIPKLLKYSYCLNVNVIYYFSLLILIQIQVFKVYHSFALSLRYLHLCGLELWWCRHQEHLSVRGLSGILVQWPNLVRGGWPQETAIVGEFFRCYSFSGGPGQGSVIGFYQVSNYLFEELRSVQTHTRYIFPYVFCRWFMLSLWSWSGGCIRTSWILGPTCLIGPVHLFILTIHRSATLQRWLHP